MIAKTLRTYRNFEIRKLYFILRKYYIRNGYTERKASELAYADLSFKYCLRPSSLRHARDIAARTQQNAENEIQFKNMIKKMSEIIRLLKEESEKH